MRRAPIGFAAVVWKHFLIVICWSVALYRYSAFIFPRPLDSLEVVEKKMR